MAFQITGIILHIGNIESIPYKDQVFNKRELVLDCSYRNQFTGQIERPNYPKFEFTGNQVEEVNGYKNGDIVTVSFSLVGSRTMKDGQARYFTNIRGFKIEKYQTRYNNQPQGVNQGPQASNEYQPINPTQGHENAPHIASQYQGGYNAQPQSFPPAVDEQGSPIQQTNDDLPF